MSKKLITKSKLEKEQKNIDQCNPELDPLALDYHYDIICLTRREFKEKGITPEVLEELKRKVTVLFPWDAGYNATRQNVNRRFNIFPVMIILAKSTEDVMTAIKFARKYNIQPSARGGAHSAEGYSLCSGMVIDQGARKGIIVDQECKDVVYATIEPGNTNGTIIPALSKYGLALPAGTCPGVGIGAPLGGGVGLTMRRFGLTCDNLVELEMVDAEGKLIRANKTENSDLFWASQGGGGGNMGIITSLKLQVFPVDKVIVFDLRWPLTPGTTPDSLSTMTRQLTSIVDAWQKWAPATNDKISSIMSLRPQEIKLLGFYLGKSKTNLRTLLQPILDISVSREKTDLFRAPYIDARRYAAGPPDRIPYFKVKSVMVKKYWTAPAFGIIAKFLSIAPPDSNFALEAFGGAVNRVKPTATAFVHRQDLFWGEFVTLWTNPEDEKKHLTWAQDFYTAMSPFVQGSRSKPRALAAYVNVVDVDLPDYMESYYGKNKRRLALVKNKYDPDNVFHFPQSIKAA